MTGIAARLKYLLLFVCLHCVSPLVLAQSDAVDQYMKAQLERRRIPGAALLVVQRGEIVKLQGYGLANVELGVPVTGDTVFELASLTKQFTATAIMLLAEEGRLRLDDRISGYLPDTPDTWAGMTVRHLLTHTAGLASPEKGFASLRAGGARLNYTTAQMYASAIRDPVSSAPGERYQYSDVGYFLLGMIIEKASGRTYRQFVSERFFKPLGMTSTSVVDPWVIVKNRAAGYTLRGGELVHIRRDVRVELPSHYGVLSTVRDLAKWDAALAAGKVVTPSSLQQMWTLAKLNDGSPYPYGFGWAVDDKRGHRWISHTGITGTEYARYPDDGLVVIVLGNLGANIGASGIDAWGLTTGVAGRYIPDLLVSSLAAEADPDPGLAVRLRGLLESLAADAEGALATPKLRSLIVPRVREILASRLEAMTAFTYIQCEKSAPDQQRLGARIERLCHYKMVTGSETRYYTFWLTPEGLVADFNSAPE